MPEEPEIREDEMSYTRYGLTPDEGRELRRELDPGDWQALLAVQRIIAEAPEASPDAGFPNRVLSRLAARERAQAQRLAVLGGLAFGLGSLALTAFLIWSSPLGALSPTASWVSLADGIAQLVPALTTVLILVQTFASVVLDGGGQFVLLALTLFTAGLILLWTRIVVGSPLNRLTRATEA